MSGPWDGLSLEGRGALVTGAGAPDGIGFATARLLAARGARVALASTTDRIEERAAEIGGGAVGLAGDLRDEEQAGALARAASQAVGTVSVLVNNAGMVQAGQEMAEPPFLEMTAAQWQEEIDRSLGITARMCRLLAPAMAASGWGRIVNVSSVTGPLAAFPGASAYAAAKAGVDGLTRALALELGPAGVTVNSVAPGWILTGSLTDREAAAGAATPAGRCGTPEEIDRSLGNTARMCRLLAPARAASGWGRIVNVSSVTGPLAAFPGASAYAAAKAGVDGLTRALALELGPAGVTVNSVAPGWILTGSLTDREAAAGAATPAGRCGTPEEIAETIAFLCGPGASYLSGQSIVVDGANIVQEMKGA